MKWYKLNRNYLIKINRYFNLIGIYLIKIFFLKNLFKFISQYLLFKKLGGKVKSFYPILDDFKDKAGPTKNQFFHSDLLTSQKVFEKKPFKHLDIGSRIDGVVAQIASYRELDVLDIRDLEIKPHKNINFLKKDLTDIAKLSDDEKYDSISSIGCLAHIGLGRYGDKIDPQGYKKGIRSINEFSKEKCNVYILVPVGIERVEFNAHNIFDAKKIVKEFEIYNFDLKEFHLITDDGNLVLNSKIEESENLSFGGGYFVFQKLYN